MNTDIVRDDRHFLDILPSDWYGNYILAKSERKLVLDHFRTELIHDCEDTVEELWLKQRRAPLMPMQFVVRRNIPAVDEEGNLLLDDDGNYVGDNDSFGYKIECEEAPPDHPWHARWPIALDETRETAWAKAGAEDPDQVAVEWAIEHAAFRAMTDDNRVWDIPPPHRCKTPNENVLGNVVIPEGRHLGEQIRRAKEKK